MKSNNFLLGLFVGFAIVLASGSLGRQAMRRISNAHDVAHYERIRIAQHRKAEEKKQQQEFEDKIGLPNFKQRFEALETQVKTLNELPTNKRQLKYYKRKIRKKQRDTGK